MVASEEAGWVGEARAQDVVICCRTEVDGVFLEETMSRDDLCANGVEVPVKVEPGPSAREFR